MAQHLPYLRANVANHKLFKHEKNIYSSTRNHLIVNELWQKERNQKSLD